MVKRNCLRCDKKFGTYPSRIKTGEGKYCSHSCSAKSTKNSSSHGMIDTRLYKIWGGIKARCLNINKPTFKNYGGRGIKVCDRWLKFENFYKDMYQPYIKHAKKFSEKNTSIDRIDNNKGYCKENCRWATYRTQALNQRHIKPITFNGKTKYLTEWADELNVNCKTLHSRIFRGWSIEKALTEPVNK